MVLDLKEVGSKRVRVCACMHVCMLAIVRVRAHAHACLQRFMRDAGCCVNSCVGASVCTCVSAYVCASVGAHERA